MTPDPAHSQAPYRVRMEWGPTGAGATAGSGDVAVVVDVLSFTTTLTVSAERGIDVLPFRWRDERAASYAAENDAVLAVGRAEARDGSGVSLSPASLLTAEGIDRIVLPSPNGSSISFGLAEGGVDVVGASLRNRNAAASYLAEQGGVGTVVAAGERWPDGSLRPAVEDLWGAGAVLAALVDLGIDDLSPEARAAEAAFRAVQAGPGGLAGLAGALRSCASGRELVDAGFADDVEVAAQLDVAGVVPVLMDGMFTGRHTSRSP